ncbi:MAG: response regulator transcription factor [Archangiaceae bacterium]|nr:response regulator transcription factor [Archangiaceae bacterium]
MSVWPALRALVIDDEWPARNYLVELLEGTGLAHVVGAVATVEEAQAAVSPGSQLGVEVAFVDVQLARDSNDRAGLELARELTASSSKLLVVLATAFEEHALDAFALGAVDYLLKPFSEERVRLCLERLQTRRAPEPQKSQRIVARKKKNLVFLEPDEIWAFEAADRLTFVHTRHGRLDIDLSLSAIELSMGRSFLRVHRNWLVNGQAIKELDREDAETSLFVGESLSEGGVGVRVPVARDRSQQVKDVLLQSAVGVRRG